MICSLSCIKSHYKFDITDGLNKQFDKFMWGLGWAFFFFYRQNNSWKWKQSLLTPLVVTLVRCPPPRHQCYKSFLPLLLLENRALSCSLNRQGGSRHQQRNAQLLGYMSKTVWASTSELRAGHHNKTFKI